MPIVRHSDVDALLDHGLVSWQVFGQHFLALDFCVSLSDLYIFDMSIAYSVDARRVDPVVPADRLKSFPRDDEGHCYGDPTTFYALLNLRLLFSHLCQAPFVLLNAR